MKSRFPKTLSTEFLLVDVVNNLKELAEDKEEVQNKIKEKVSNGDKKKLLDLVELYGKVQTKKLFREIFR